MEQRTADTVIADLKKIVSERKPLNRELWLEAAFYLSLFREDEAQKLNRLNQEVSKLKLSVMDEQQNKDGKKNVAAADVVVSASDKFLEMKNQEARITTIDELIRVSKKNAESSY